VLLGNSYNSDRLTLAGEKVSIELRAGEVPGYGNECITRLNSQTDIR